MSYSSTNAALICILGHRDGTLYVPVSYYAIMPQYVFNECLLRNITLTVVSNEDNRRFTFVPFQQDSKHNK